MSWINFLFPQSKSGKIINFILSGITLLYVSLIMFPMAIFGHVLEYKKFTIYSTSPLDSQITEILDQSEINLTSSEIYSSGKQKIFICNNQLLYTFLAPGASKAFACNYPVVNNIFIANCDVRDNLAYKKSSERTRNLHELIAHEITHSFIDKHLGLVKSKLLPDWINEGYCDYIGYNEKYNHEEAKNFLMKNSTSDQNDLYKKYYYAVGYLLDRKQISLHDLFTARYTFDDTIREIISVD
jgi:hypothetical protein